MHRQKQRVLSQDTPLPIGAKAPVGTKKGTFLIIVGMLFIMAMIAGCGGSSQQLPVNVPPSPPTSTQADDDTADSADSADEPSDSPTEEMDNAEEITDDADATETDTAAATAEEITDDADATETDTADTTDTEDTEDADATETDTADTEDTDDADATETDTADTTDTEDTEDADATETDTANTDAGTEDDDTGADAEQGESSTMDDLIADTRHFKGDANAPVTIIEFSDFQCGYCKRFANQTEPQIEQHYLEEGIVRMGFRHAAYQGEGSMLAAAASECAADQDAFWEFHENVMQQNQQLTADVLKQVASDLGLDEEAFNTCVDNGTYAESVLNQTRESQAMGVTGTPTFFINGKRLVGAQPLEAFQEVIEAAEAGELEPDIDEVQEAAPEQPTSPEELMDMMIAKTRHFKGDEDAPVTIIEFSDFQCPYCSRFAHETGTRIDEEFVDTGLVRFGYMHAAYHGGEAFLAAEASECAADQDAFWDYHDLLIQRLAVENKHDFPEEVLTQLAEDLELNMDEFGTCMDTDKYAEFVQSQTQESQAIGVQGTPTFLVMGKELQGIVGAQPFEAFEAAIQAQLDDTGSDGAEVPDATVEPDGTAEPIATEVPIATEEPVATEVPDSTAEPVATEVPIATEEPVATEVPDSTAEPVATEVPVETEE